MVMMIIFGIVGYLMRKFQYEAAPLVLALVLGKELEKTFRQSLMMSEGDFSIFISRYISVGFLAIAALLLIIPVFTQRKKLSTLKE
jgi:putative tricarboxylic transport membrane protein